MLPGWPPLTVAIDNLAGLTAVAIPVKKVNAAINKNIPNKRTFFLDLNFIGLKLYHKISPFFTRNLRLKYLRRFFAKFI